MIDGINKAFLASLQEIVVDMAQIQIVSDGNFVDESSQIKSLGVTSMINFSGMLKGRIMLDMEESLALEIAKNVLGQEYTTTKDAMVLATISEMNNIFSGGAVTTINNAHSLKLWMSPPFVLTGKNATICIPKIASKSITCTSNFGKVRLNIAIERGV